MHRLCGAFLRAEIYRERNAPTHLSTTPASYLTYTHSLHSAHSHQPPSSMLVLSLAVSQFKHQTGARRVLRLHSQWLLTTKSQIQQLMPKHSAPLRNVGNSKHVRMTARDPSKRVQRGGKPPSLADSHPTTARPLHVARSHATEYHSHAKTAQTPRLPSPTPMAGGASCGCQLAVHVCCCPISNHLRPRNTGPGACRPGSPSAPASAARRPGPLLLLCRIPP